MSGESWFRASAIMAAGTLVSRILGFVKAMVLVAVVGVTMSGVADAYALATQLPNSIYAIVVGGILNAILVPQIVRASLNPDGGQKYINRLITLGMVVAAIATIGLTFASPFLVQIYAGSALESHPQVLELATVFGYWVMPQVFFFAVYNILGEVLNAKKHYGPYMWTPALNNLIAILGMVVFLVLYGPVPPDATGFDYWGSDRILLLAGTATLGTVLQAWVLFGFWKKIGLKFRLDFHWRGTGFRRIGKIFGWSFGTLILTQLGALIITRVAIMATSEAASLAALNTAELFIMLPNSIAAVSISTAFFTRFSESALTDDKTKIKSDVSELTRIIGLITTISAAILIVTAVPFSHFFVSDSVQATQLAEVIIAYSPAVIFMSFSYAVRRIFFAYEDTKTPFFIYLFHIGALVIGVFLSTGLPTEYLAVGIAASNSVANALQAIFSVVFAKRKLGGFETKAISNSHLKFLLAALIAAAAGYTSYYLLGGFSPAGFALANQGFALITTIVIAAVMGLVYLFALKLLRSVEINLAWQSIKAKLGR